MLSSLLSLMSRPYLVSRVRGGCGRSNGVIAATKRAVRDVFASFGLSTIMGGSTSGVRED